MVIPKASGTVYSFIYSSVYIKQK